MLTALDPWSRTVRHSYDDRSMPLNTLLLPRFAAITAATSRPKSQILTHRTSALALPLFIVASEQS